MSTKVLIIEDDPSVALALRIRLVAAGYLVHHSSKGCTGIEDALKLRPDVIVLDILLPDMDGFEVCSTIRGYDELAQSKVMFHTVHAQPAFRKCAEEAGCDLFLPKKHGTAGVLQGIKSLLDRGRRASDRPPTAAPTGTQREECA